MYKGTSTVIFSLALTKLPLLFQIGVISLPFFTIIMI